MPVPDDCITTTAPRPTYVHAVEAEAGVAVGSDGRVEEARSVLDFQNQSVFMYTSMPRADGQNQGSKDLVIKATVSRTSASSFAYLSSEQQEMVGRAAVSLHKMQGLQSRRLRLPLRRGPSHRALCAPRTVSRTRHRRA